MKAWKRILMIGLVVCLLIGCTTMIMPKAAESADVITLDSAQLIYNGWHNKKIRLTFSDKVSIPADGSYIYLASSIAGGACSNNDGTWQSHPQVNTGKGYIEYLDGEVVGGKTYASVIDLYFDHCCSTHKSLWADYKMNVIPDGAVVYLNDADDTTKFVGIDGQSVKTTGGRKAHVELTPFGDPIEDGIYTISNVNTGNSISVDGDNKFKLVKAPDQGDGIYTVAKTDGTTPITLVLGGSTDWKAYYPTTASDTQYVRVVDCGNGQYRLLAHVPSTTNRFSKTYAYDSGNGTSAKAELAIAHLDANLVTDATAKAKWDNSLWTLTKQVEFESAELLYANAYYKKIRLTFSDKVAIPADGAGIYLAYCAEANGCSGTTDNKCLSRPLKEGSEKGHFEYVDGVEKDGVMYASVIDMHFRRCVNNSRTAHESLWDTTYQYNTIPEGAEVRLTSLDTAGYVGIDGGAVLPTSGTKAVVSLTYASSPIANGTYNIMNCDTGRSIMIGDVDEWTFTLQSNLGDDIYKVTNQNGERVDIMANTSYGSSTYSPVVNASTETYIRIADCGNGRYQLFGYIPSMSNRLGATYILDSGSGNTNAAVLQNYHVDDASLIMDVRCLWYLTKEGDTRPLKVMPLGDSITNGDRDGAENSDKTQWVAYRAQLSEQLIEKYGRVVFVGENVTTYDAGLSSKRLLRHAGYSGYAITDAWPDDAVNRGQIKEKIDLNLTKFKPDLVLMQIGTNDITDIYNNNGQNNINEQVKQEQLNALIGRYNELAQKIEENLDDNGLLMCSTVTPRSPYNNQKDERVTMVKDFNVLIAEYVTEQATAGKKMVLVDNYAAVNALGTEAIYGDLVHITPIGSAAMADTYLKAITAQYDADSIKKNNVQGQLAKAQAGDTVALTANVATGSVGIPADVTLDLNGHVLAADEVFGITKTSYLVDSKDGLGGLKIEKDNLSFIGENEQMPLYDATIGGYRFFDFELEYQTRETTETKVKYGIRVDLPSEQAYALLDDADNCKTVRILLTLTKEGETPKNIDYAFRTETVEDYVSKSSADLNKKYGLMLTVSGLDEAEAQGYTLSATARLEMPGYIVNQAY